jgi:shikimate dehydrogenase
MKHYGLAGSSLTHSFSKKFFEDFFRTNNIPDAVYENYELESIETVAELLKSSELLGLNITFPYKEAIIPFLEDLDHDAKEAGAVNCLKKTGKGWKGFNTDIEGFRESITPLLHPRHKKALVFGTGGASKAAQFVFRQLGIGYKLVSNSGKNGTFRYEDLTEQDIHQFLILVNCTPLGTYPDIASSVNIPYHAIGKRHLLYDLVYNPARTDFLRSGQEMGATIKNGYEMLKIQALASWRIWQDNAI